MTNPHLKAAVGCFLASAIFLIFAALTIVTLFGLAKHYNLGLLWVTVVVINSLGSAFFFSLIAFLSGVSGIRHYADYLQDVHERKSDNRSGDLVDRERDSDGSDSGNHAA